MTDVVGSTDRDAHQLVLAVGAGSRHTGLDEVAEAVRLVPPLQVAVARALPWRPNVVLKYPSGS